MNEGLGPTVTISTSRAPWCAEALVERRHPLRREVAQDPGVGHDHPAEALDLARRLLVHAGEEIDDRPFTSGRGLTAWKSV